MPITSRPPTPRSAKIFLTVFLTPFALLGLVGGVFAFRSFYQALHTETAWGGLLAGFFLCLVFTLIGMGGIYLIWRPPAPPRRVGTTWIPTPQGVGEADQPLVLHPTSTRLARFLGTVVFATFWDGITGVFVWHVIDGFQHGDRAWGIALFLSIFVLIGLAMLLAVPYSFLALWNPRPKLVLSTPRLHLGETFVLQWSFAGLPGRLRQLGITLEGREETVVQQGKSSRTLKEVFSTQQLADTTERDSIDLGTLPVTIPKDAMHSLASGSCRVVWTIQMKGQIPFWPDLEETFEVTVLPQEPQMGGWR